MDTVTRTHVYARLAAKGRSGITARQHRRIVKKAGRDPHAVVGRDEKGSRVVTAARLPDPDDNQPY